MYASHGENHVGQINPIKPGVFATLFPLEFFSIQLAQFFIDMTDPSIGDSSYHIVSASEAEVPDAAEDTTLGNISTEAQVNFVLEVTALYI